jgi:putative transposase
MATQIQWGSEPSFEVLRKVQLATYPALLGGTPSHWERYHKAIKSDAIRPGRPETLEEGRELVERLVAHYNGVRLHSATGYITPNDCLAGRSDEIWAARDAMLEDAREARRLRRQEAA